MSLKRKHWSLVLEISCLLLISLPSVLLRLFATPYRRGFFCSDLSIAYPSSTSHSTLNALFILTDLVLPFLVVSLWEIVCQNRNLHLNTVRDPIQYSMILLTCQRFLIPYLFTLIAGLSFIDIGKYSVGMLSPQFLAVCHPDVQCSSDSKDYITNYTCLLDSDDALQDRLTFPSSSAAFALCSSSFISFYLQEKMDRSALRQVLCLVLLCLSWARCLYLVVTYQNHPEDVVTGMIVGFLMAMFVRLLLSTPSSYHSKDYIQTDYSLTVF